MVVKDIFAVIEECLFAVQFSTEELDELDKIFEQWNDPNYLHDFFSEHIDDLQSGFFGDITVEQAVARTQRDAKKLQAKLLDLANQGLAGSGGNLSQLFKAISPKESGKSYEKDKAYGVGHSSWLRIYAIRINVNVFVISGGGIKLTPTMNERAHLEQELHKLDLTRKFIEESTEYADYFYELSL